jgi:hypothetical protein
MLLNLLHFLNALDLKVFVNVNVNFTHKVFTAIIILTELRSFEF